MPHSISKWHISTWLIISLILLNIYDFTTTYIAIGQGATESNPILEFLMIKTSSIWVILWFKGAVLGLLCIPYALMPKYRVRCQTTEIMWALGGLNLIYLAIVVSSLFKIITFTLS